MAWLFDFLETTVKGIQLSTGAQGSLQLINVYHGYYCNIAKDAQPITVNDVEYRRGDPISWWDYQNYLETPNDPNKVYFIRDDEDDALNDFNNMNHENGFVLSFEFDDNNADLRYWNPTPYTTPYNLVEKGPSFSTTSDGVYGKYHYDAGDLISATEVSRFSSTEGLTQHPYDDYMLCV